ncbi:ATP-binding protein [Plantactinospora sp. CA-290183]|uniref:ATP-binding protein n=1 Tax=Plantactinospora sp. CA-290183 TaxID=3240006 RepID=UPI003D8FCCAE
MFAGIVRAHRHRLGLTQEDLAARTGLSVRAIGRLEAGRIAAPRPPTVRLLADAFGLTGEDRDRFCQSARDGSTAPPVSAPVPAQPAASVRVPAQLPPDVSAFTGRGAELALLDELVAGVADEPTALIISAVSGTAGVGKTALAVHWSHRSRGRFPDGQLYVNLRGYDTDRPVDAGDALAGFLSALGVAARDVPVDMAERAARYRTELADRRMLILLDNASSVEQVRPLLPGTASCAVLVTSRDSLAGLVAVHGARRLDLDLLPDADAIAFLRRLIGRRAEAEPTAAATLAAQCARLPLSLRVAAELAVSRPTRPLTDLVAELADRKRRLSLLDPGGAPHADVRSVFSWSVRHLPPDASRLFRLLGLHPGPDYDAYAVAALAGTDLDTARELLDVLVRAHLVHPTGGGRYGMHDLLGAYAASLATAETRYGHPTDAPATALGRLFDYYVAAAASAMDHLYPAEALHRPQVPETAAAMPDLDGADASRRWLDSERACLVGVAVDTSARDWRPRAVRLSTVLYRYLDGGHHSEALAVHTHARDAARQSGDRAGEARALLGIGAARLWIGESEPAVQHFEQALALSRQVDDRGGQTRALNSLGVVHRRLGDYPAAADYQWQAVLLARQTGDRTGEARALSNLGIVEHLSGRPEPAATHLGLALALFRQTGDRTGEANALHNLGKIELLLGQPEPAAERLRAALDLYRHLGNPRGEATTLDCLGTLHTRSGRSGPATEDHTRALALFREIGERGGESSALNGLGEAAQAAGDPAAALTHHTAALVNATETGGRDQQARAHAGLGLAYRALADPVHARHHYSRALALYTDLGSADAADMRARLAGVNGP